MKKNIGKYKNSIGKEKIKKNSRNNCLKKNRKNRVNQKLQISNQ